MSREAGETRGDLSFSVPTWLITLGKVSFPAIVLGVGMYFRMEALEKSHDKVNVEVDILKLKLTDKSDKILLLEQKQETMKALDAVSQNNSMKALERIETELKLIQTDVKDIRAKQTQVMSTNTR